MTRLSMWTVRTALLYLGVGFFVGALMLTQKGLPFDPSILQMLPLHIELVLFGWTLQLAMGIAFWILPRFSREPRYGNQRLGWIAYGLLNLGVLSAGAGAWVGAPPLVVLSGRLLELAAVVSFALHAWQRVRPIGI
jgi:cbb3-type cytochrome oxidase subunit 1